MGAEFYHADGLAEGETNLTILHTYLPMKMEQSVPKRRHTKFRRRGITQKKTYNIDNADF
jgi:hypothetical protein